MDASGGRLFLVSNCTCIPCTHTDWVCGGQWNRMVSFIQQLVTTLRGSSIEVVVFFNGAIEPQRLNEWIAFQRDEYKKSQQVSLAHESVALLTNMFFELCVCVRGVRRF